MTQEQKPAKIFIAYSHKDEEYRDQLVGHASQLKQNGLVEIWHDRKLLPGSEWEGEIDKKLSDADIFIPLMSSDFIASDYCSDVEMKKALEMHARHEILIIPVVVRPCDWIHGPLAVLQALPASAKAVSSWNDTDEAWLSVIDGIRTDVGQLDEMRQNSIFFSIGIKESASTVEVRRMIYEGRPEAAAACKTYMQGFLARLDELAPKFEPEENDTERDSKSLKAINNTEKLIADYSAVTQSIAQHGAFDAAMEIQKSFAGILQHCEDPVEWGYLSNLDADFYRFLGHELCTILYAVLLSERQWAVIEKLLQDISLPKVRGISQIRKLPTIWDLSGRLILTMRMSTDPQRTPSLCHAELLKKRYQSELLQKVSPFPQFLAGDFLLAIASAIWKIRHLGNASEWTPWSAAYFYDNIPVFVQEIRTHAGCESVCKTIGARSTIELKQAIQQVLNRMGSLLQNRRYQSAQSELQLDDMSKY